MIDPRNYIPGCASYTKASEISSLQKYLKKGIKKRDEELELQENPEGLGGDPRVPGITELPKEAIGLHDPREVTELPGEFLKITNPREETLESHRENITPVLTPELSNEIIGLEDTREATLETHREDISVPETNSLVDHRENIEYTHDVTELSRTRLDINEALIPELPTNAVSAPGEITELGSLEDTKVLLEGTTTIETGSLEATKIIAPGSETVHEVTELPGTVVEGPESREVTLGTVREDIKGNENPGSLEDYRDNISDNREVALEDYQDELNDHRGVSLEDHRESLKGKHNPKLSDYKDTIKDKRSVSLEDHQEALEDKRSPRLSDHKDTISDKRSVFLEDHQETIEDKNTPKLSDHKDTITDKRNVSLEDRRETLENKQSVSLETHREGISDDREPSLETRKDLLEDKRNSSLDDTQLKTPGKQKTPELSGTIISGPEIKEIGLDKSRVSIEDKRGVVLETQKDAISDKHNPKLSDHREDISDKRNPELPGTIIGLSDKRSITLENHKDTLEDSRDPSLSNHRENLNAPGTPGLPIESVGLESPAEVSLVDHRENLNGVPETPGLPEDSEKMPEGTKDVTLSESSEGIPGESKEPKLETTKITRPGSDIEVGLTTDTHKLEGITEVGSLETERLDITNDQEVSLPQDRLGITDNSEVTLPEGALPIEGEVPETESLEDTRLERPGETPDVNQIYSDTTGKELYPLEGLDINLPAETQLDITNDHEPVLEDERINVTDDNEPFLEDARIDIVTPDAPELVTIPKIKAEPEDNWTREPNLNPTLPGGVADINDILGLETEALKIMPHITEASMDPDHAQRFVDTSQKHSFSETPDGVSSSIESEFSEGTIIGLKQYGEETKDPKTMDFSQPNLATPNPWETGTDLNYIDTRSKEDLEGYGEDTKNPLDFKEDPRSTYLGPNSEDNIIEKYKKKAEESVKMRKSQIVEVLGDPDHKQDFIDTSQNHSFSEESDGVSSSIESEFSKGTIIGLKRYGEETKNPELRPNQPDEIITEDHNWEHIDTPSMSQDDFNEYNKRVKITEHVIEESADPDHRQRRKLIDISQNHSFEEKSDKVSSSIESEFSDISELKKYGEETENPELRPNQPDEIITEDPNWKHTDILNMNQDDFNEYIGNQVKMRGSQKVEILGDPDHKQNFIDISQNHSFSQKPDEVSSSIESKFSEKTISKLEKYGEETGKPLGFEKDARSTYLGPKSDDGRIKKYREKAERPVKIEESKGITIPTKENPEADRDALQGPYDWAKHHMGRQGWKPQELAIPAYKLGGSFTSFLNPSKYLRWAVENTVGAIPLKNGSAKQWLLDEALAGLIAARDKLEESLNLQPYRLPGSSEYAIRLLRQGMSGVDLRDAENFVGNTAANLLSSGAVIIKNPINRPDTIETIGDGKTKKTHDPNKMKKFESKDGQNGADIESIAGSVIEEANKIKKKASEVVTKALGSNQGLGDYYPKYLLAGPNGLDESNLGLRGTIENLTRSSLNSVVDKGFAELKDAIENSPYITSSSKLIGRTAGDIHRHDVALTLDSNHVWEIILEPYLGPENGNKSFLPSIQQINYENFYNFGLCTNWDTWIPFTSFELNTKKMVQKNLLLYSGEISIPQNLEFTNELRLVICDDQYKSWKRYFDYVMYSSTYLCQAHNPDYFLTKKFIKYMGDLQNTFGSEDLQMYYKGVVRPAPYKNLAFRCKIFSMNPQYQTVNMSDLLVVLKDFTEEWQGEIDASPTELALMFSVVGENPEGYSFKTLPEANYRIKTQEQKFNKYSEKMSKGIAISL